jgi:rhodanese-related sulfurtransferase
MNQPTKIITQVFAVLVFSGIVAFVTNAARDDRLPLVMPFPPSYQCPSYEKPGLPVALRMALNLYGRPGTVFIDARKGGPFEQGHIEGAISIPYSFVEPISKESLDGLRGFISIVVYCNRKDSETSKLMAGEIAQTGFKGVVYLEQGFLGWVKAGGRYTGKPPEGYEE